MTHLKNKTADKTLRMPKFFGLFLAFTSVLTVSTTHADEAAIKLLNKMNQALHELNYTGTLAYLRGDTLSSLRIEHSVVNGVKSERVVRLNEQGNEVSRELEGFSLESIPQINAQMNAVYSFDMGRENRIANIPCRIITARPKDRERYLQKYCIDANTGMLLDYMLVGKSHKPVEQFMFTSIEIKMPEKRLEGAVSAESTAIINNKISTAEMSTRKVMKASLSNAISNATLDDGWVMEALPAGFTVSQAPSMKSDMSAQDAQQQGAVAETKHYIVSDGLSSLSLFVSPYTKGDPAESIKVNSGALNIVTQKKGDHIITAVGEVPEATLRDIVNNLQKK